MNQLNEPIIEITSQIIEQQDEFIYKTITPFCETYYGSINKQTLIDALTMWKDRNNYKLVTSGVWTLHKNGTATCSVCKRTCGSWDYDSYDRFCRCCGSEMSLKENTE